ncbi:MAG: DUF1801 domain-containing protein [Gammaproteobacteria bacterium]
MDDVLRFTGGTKRDPAVDTWLRTRSEEHRPIVSKWFERLRRCGPDVRELLHDGAATACVGDVPFAYVGAFKDHVNMGFFNGAALDDTFELLEGTGKRMRHVKLRADVAVDAHSLDELIRAAYLDGQARAGRASR